MLLTSHERLTLWNKVSNELDELRRSLTQISNGFEGISDIKTSLDETTKTKIKTKYESDVTLHCEELCRLVNGIICCTGMTMPKGYSELEFIEKFFPKPIEKPIPT